MKRPPLPRKPLDLALVVIARNEARCIRRCLLSAREHVSRMLVLDTGSTDDTAALARRCGAEVHHAAWNEDFSAARNTALELAAADWNLILDADEWISSGAQCLHLVEEATEPFTGVVLVRSDFNIGARREHSHTWLPRLLPRGVRYQGRIHESPVSAWPRRPLSLVLGHDGYLPSQLASKAGRNRELLLREVRARPDDPYMQYQLGKDFEIGGEFAQACDHYVQALALTPVDASYRQDASVRLLYCLSQSGQLEQALVLSGDMLDGLQESPDYFFTLGNLLLDSAVQHPAQAFGHWLPLAEAAWLRCLEIGERPMLDGVPGRGSYLAAHNLAVLYEGMDQTDKATHYRKLARQLRG
ncbi:tetratricopeptide repeat-containing glycosyltransferase family 2 protein [Azohydromonas australica]|uniref:tetratricopeptide repeat-containing glycosyltransferase family 2 protein n=1 Tax=Azohydromonas australica TaxID=364039 RepID=UPI00048E9E33|nr:glycosyltransferase family 2 protein [Azohydromonas australica]